jgi:hypothetical protein
MPKDEHSVNPPLSPLKLPPRPSAAEQAAGRGTISNTMVEMRALTPDEIQTALKRLETALDLYVWLQRNTRLCDVRTNEDFQRRYCRFYRVRRDSRWRSVYFDLLESSKLKGIDFPEALQEINRHTHRLEASFASKLVATLDPSKPVIDRFVLEYFELRLPRWGLSDREPKTIGLYYDLCDKYRTLMQSPTGTMIRELFESQYPNLEISALKKIDLVLWKTRR